MDNLPYDIHEHIFSFILNKVDRFAYVDAYDNLEMWKQYALSLTKNIKYKYNKPRKVIDHDIMQGVTFYLSLDSGFECKGRFPPRPDCAANHVYYMACPCGVTFPYNARTKGREELKRTIRRHKNTEKHKKNMIDPIEISTGHTDERYHISKHFTYDGPW